MSDAVPIKSLGLSGSRQRRGFTLLEVLATLGVGSALLLVFLPALADHHAEIKARECAANLGQLGRAVALYAEDHQDSLPGCQHAQPAWSQSLVPYGRPVLICPTIAERPGKFSVALNDFLTPHPYGARTLDFSKRARTPRPGETLTFAEVAEEFRAYDHFHFAESREFGFTPMAFSMQVDVERHDSGANYLFGDGHVQPLDWSGGVKPKLEYPGSRFVRPDGAGAANEIDLARFAGNSTIRN